MTPQKWLLVNKTEPLPGDFIVERGSGPIAQLIEWRQGGEWSHLSIPVSTFAKVETHIIGGFQASLLNFDHPWAYMRLRPELQERINVDRWKERIAWHTKRKTRYDFRGIRAAFWNRFGRDEKDSFYCSELLDDLLTYSSGLEVTSGWPWPQTCYQSGLYNAIGSSVIHGEFLEPLNKNHILKLL